jgi:hypothetical protein
MILFFLYVNSTLTKAATKHKSIGISILNFIYTSIMLLTKSIILNKNLDNN